MEHSSRFFENRECEYFPCHKLEGNFNCLFCYCPLNHLKNCLGTPEYIEVNGTQIKDCSNCTFPHKPENYDAIIKMLSKM